MELDLLGTHADRAYPILAGLVVPRPIAWVTTLHENGTVNAAPFSFFNHRVHIRDEFIDPATLRIRQELYHPVGRMAVPDWYCHTADLFELPRPR